MMMSINNNPFKVKENSTTATTTNNNNNTSTNITTNGSSPSVKTRPIPNENILKKASIFNNFNNNNNNNTNNNGTNNIKPFAGFKSKTLDKQQTNDSVTKTPYLSKLKSNGVSTTINASKNTEITQDKETNLNNNHNNTNHITNNSSTNNNHDKNNQVNHKSENNSSDAAETNSTSSSDAISNSNITTNTTTNTKGILNDMKTTNSELDEYDDVEEVDEEEVLNKINSNHVSLQTEDDQIYDINIIRRKLAEEQYLNKQLKLENDTLHEELQDIRHEMEELQDQFRLDDADEFRQLQAELEIAAKNCRILQFKLRKLEKKNESLETEKIMLQDKLDEFSRETGKLLDLEEELLIAKEVSIRLHGELEQAQEWRLTTENLNKELKKQLDELKDHLDNEIKSRNYPNDQNELVLVNKLYESMFREYFMQEQLYTMSNNLQSQNVSKQLREVTDLLSSYQQKIALLNDEISLLKQQSASKDKEMDQMRLQLKNLKRSRSQENDRLSYKNTSSSDLDSGDEAERRQQRSGSVENQNSASTDTLSRQVEIGKDEIRLLKNKIMRLEDDLFAMTQERDSLLSQLEKIEDKAMKSFDTNIPETDSTELEIDSNFVKKMNELKNKIDELNDEAKQNDETRQQLSMEILQLKEKLDEKLIESKTESNNLTDSDKLLRDQYKQVKSDLDDKINQVNTLESELDLKNDLIKQLKYEIDSKESQLNESIRQEKEFNEKYAQTQDKLNDLNKQINDYESVISGLKSDLECKNKLEINLKNDSSRLNATLDDFSTQLKEKLSEIEFLNRENNALQDRVNNDESKINMLTNDLENHKTKIDQLKHELDDKNSEFKKFENLIKLKENELNEFNKKLVIRDQVIKEKVKECEMCRRDLNDLQDKCVQLTTDSDEKIKNLNDEIDKLSSEKDKIYGELVELTDKHNQCKNAESDQEKQALKKLEQQALNAKYEMKIQYLELEIDTLRSKIRKLLKEKEVQDQILKENQLIVKEIALKYTTDSETWNRQKQKLLEKEKLYEESVDMRKELKKAADKLRQKLQSLEEQIIDKQNKHTIEKNNWETQRLQYLSQNNKLEEQLSKLSTLKRSKKEMEMAWDKERREMANHIQNLEEFIKALQLQLTQRNSSITQVTDPYGQNEKIQSLFGENEFLKNRIKELEVMLDEMDQVKRFLFDVKEAYDADRHEWILAKEEFRYQLEIKENLWLECNNRLNQLINIIQAIQSKEPLPANLFDENASVEDGSTTDSLLNNLVGGTSNLLDFKLGASQRNLAKQNSVTSQTINLNPLDANRNLNGSKLNLRSLAEPQLQQILPKQPTLDENNFALVDITKDRKELNIEFDQAFKKMNRVKDNYGTHKKFMDIVKSKSMKALNRKSSTASLPQSELLYQPQLSGHESRGSVPPEYSNNNKMAQILSSQRAKSVSKEPVQRGDSQTSQTSTKSTTSSIFTAPGRFFSLSRIRSRLSSQPPPPIPTSSPSATHLGTETYEQNEQNESDSDYSKQHMSSPVQIQITQQPVLEDKSKKSIRERALSPGKLLRSLRPRSPFTRSSKPSADVPTNIITTTVGSSGVNKSFTVGSSLPNDSFDQPSEHIDRRQYLTSTSYQSNSFNSNITDISSVSSNNRFVRANTAGPSDHQSRASGAGGFAFLAQTLTNDKLRSASCEFIDNNNNQPFGAMNRLDETLDEVDEVQIEKSNNRLQTQKQLSPLPQPQPPPTITVAPPQTQHLQMPTIQITENTPPQVPVNRSRRPNLAAFGSLNLSTTSNSSRIELLKKNFDNVSQDKSDIVKTVKFKEPEKTKPDNTNESINTTPTKKQAPPPPQSSSSSTSSSPQRQSLQQSLNINTKETKLMQVLDEAMLSSPSTASSVSSTSLTPNILVTSDDNQNDDKITALSPNSKKLNVKFGGQTSFDEKPKGLLTTTNKIDKMPPKPPSQTLATNISNAFGLRNKFTGLNKAKTLDNNNTESSQNFAEYNHNTTGSNYKLLTGNNSNTSSVSINQSNTPILTASGKPIQSILRRSETPPNNKLNLRQPSIESTESSARETSIEKILQAKTSTSRPLMFNSDKK